jgi:hypothetical protein
VFDERHEFGVVGSRIEPPGVYNTVSYLGEQEERGPHVPDRRQDLPDPFQRFGHRDRPHPRGRRLGVA